MRLIDADELIKAIPDDTSADIFENCRNCSLLDKEGIVYIINERPTVDAVPVVIGTKVIIEGIAEKTDTIKYKEREYIEKQRLTKTDEKGIKYWSCEDVGDLIRCKDCKHFNPTKDILGLCRYFVKIMFMRDYCSRAEKRDAEQTAPTGFMSEWAREIEEQLNSLNNGKI